MLQTSKKTICINVKVPARVDNIDAAIAKMGGVEHVVDIVRKVDEKIQKIQQRSTSKNSNEAT